MRTRARQNQQNDPRVVATDDIVSLLLSNTNHRRDTLKLLAAIVCDERIDVSFRAGVAMSLAAQR